MDLSIIIVSFNTCDLLRDCLYSIFKKIDDLSFEVIVVDNASSDKSVDMVEELFPQVKLICNEENVGFAKANNQGMNIAKGRYFLLLNSDTRLKESPKKIIEFADSNAEVGIVGCRVVFGDGRLQRSCWRFPSLFREWYYFSFDIIMRVFPLLSLLKYRGIKYDALCNPDCVSGCFFLIRKEVVRSIGGFDEKFFMYYEDTEYCYRIKTSTDYKVFYYPKYEVVHHHGKSRTNSEAILMSFRSATYFFKKVRGWRQASLFMVLCKITWLLELSAMLPILVFARESKIASKAILLKNLLKCNNQVRL